MVHRCPACDGDKCHYVVPSLDVAAYYVCDTSTGALDMSPSEVWNRCAACERTEPGEQLRRSPEHDAWFCAMCWARNVTAREQHPHPRLPGMVLGTRCNVCDRPLTVAGCPLCVTCCEREP